MTADEAGGRVARASRTLHAAFFPGTELRTRDGVRPEAIDAVNRIIQPLNEAEYAFTPRIGKPSVSHGIRLVTKALDVLQQFLVPDALKHEDPHVQHELMLARAEAQRDLDAVLDDPPPDLPQ